MPTPSLIDRRRSTNLFQVASGLVGSLVGVVYALQIPAPEIWIPVVAGAWIGFLLFVLVSGALLVFVPRAQTHRFIDYEQYVQLNRTVRTAFWIFIASAPIALAAIVVFGLSQAGTLWIVGLFFLANFYVRFCQARLEDIGCPHCRGKFGLQSPFEIDKHRCGDCGRSFVMDAESCEVEPASAST